MMKNVSVIVPVLNRENLIERSLESIINQTCKPKEIIVVDNGSVDTTFETVKSWMQRHSDSKVTFKLLKENNRGACVARNKGFENATGEWLIFFDSDDEMHPDLIEKAFQVQEKNPDSDLICWKCRITSLDDGKKIPPFDIVNPLENHLIHALLRTQGYMISRSLLNKAGGWRKRLSVWNDYELGLRILLQHPKIIGIEDILVEIYSQKDSITGVGFSSKSGEWEISLDEMTKEVSLSHTPLKSRIIKILDYRKAILSAHYYKEGNKEGAKQLLKKTVDEKTLIEKILLFFTFYFTRYGLRGAWRLVGPFYKIIS